MNVEEVLNKSVKSGMSGAVNGSRNIFIKNTTLR